MKKLLMCIFLFLIIPIILFISIQKQFFKDKNILLNKNILTNKIENKEPWSIQNLEKFNQRIIKDQVIKQEFKSDHNNLGTISIQFTNFQKINDDFLLFKLIDQKTNNVVYENNYKVDQFNPDFPFTFGFPSIRNSKNKVYTFTLESKSGTLKNSVGLSDTKYFTAKYDFSLETIKINPFSGLELILINLFFLKEIFIGPLSYFTFLYIFILLIFFFRKKIIKNIPKIFFHIPFGKIFYFIEKSFPLIIFLLTFLISGFFSTIETDPHHDGIMIKPALDVSQGKMLFKDTFTQYGAVSTLIQSLSLKIFGEYLIVIKLTTAFFYGLISILIYLIWCRFLSKKLAFLSCLIWLLLAPYYIMTFLPWSSVYALFFQCLSLYFFLRFLETNNKKLLIYTGASSGLTFWCKQNVGGYVIAASVLSIILISLLKKEKIRYFLLLLRQYVLGGVLISLPIFIWIIVNGAFFDWWKQSIAFVFIFIESRSSISFINSMIPASVGPLSVWILIPLASIIAFLQTTFQKKPNFTILVVSLFGLFSWFQYYPVTCLRHVYWAATPMFGIVIFLIYELSLSIFPKKPILKYLFLLFLAYLFFYFDIKYRVNEGYKRYNKSYYYLDSPKILQGMKLTSNEANFYQKTYKEIIDYKNKNGQTNLITIGPNALYLTFDKSNNFHPMYVNWGTSLYSDYATIKDKYIGDNQPLIFSIWGLMPPGYCKFDDTINVVDSSFLIAPCKNID